MTRLTWGSLPTDIFAATIPPGRIRYIAIGNFVICWRRK
jgi:hypothetical protein